MSTHRRLAALAAMSTLALALAPSASPTVAASPASGGFTGPMVHVTLDAATLGSAPCGVSGERVYTFTQGTVVIAFPADALDSNGLHAAHWSLVQTWAADAYGTSYRVVGGETYSDPAGRLNLDIMFIGPGGGVADRATFVARAYSHAGLGFYFDFGTCAV
jgi:hypothetical protein